MIKKLFYTPLIICSCSILSAYGANDSEYCFSTSSLNRVIEKYESLDADLQRAHDALYETLSNNWESSSMQPNPQLCVSVSDIAYICATTLPDSADADNKCTEFINSFVESYNFTHVCSGQGNAGSSQQFCVDDFATAPGTSETMNFEDTVTLARIYAKNKLSYDDIVCYDDVQHTGNYDAIACATTSTGNDEILFDFKFNSIGTQNDFAKEDLTFINSLSQIYTNTASGCQASSETDATGAIVCTQNQSEETCDNMRSDIEQYDLPFSATWVEGTGCVVNDISNEKLASSKIPQPRNQNELNLLIATVQAEAGTEDDKGQRLALDVILNRVAHPRNFPNTIEGVIKAKNQFTTWPTKVNNVLRRGIRQDIRDRVISELNATKLTNDRPYLFFRQVTTNNNVDQRCDLIHGKHCFHLQYTTSVPK